MVWVIVRDYTIENILPYWVAEFNNSKISWNHFKIADTAVIILALIFWGVFYNFFSNSIHAWGISSLNHRYTLRRQINAFQGTTFAALSILIYRGAEPTVVIIYSCLLVIQAIYFIFDYFYLPDWLLKGHKSGWDSKRFQWTWKFTLFLILYIYALIIFNEALPNAVNILSFYSY